MQDDHYLGPSVDIWALGILLYLMVTGGMPFKGTTVAELKNAILDGHFEMPDYLSQSCIDLIVGILKRRPDWRLTLQQVRNSFPFFFCSFPFHKVYICSSRHLELKRIELDINMSYKIERDWKGFSKSLSQRLCNLISAAWKPKSFKMIEIKIVDDDTKLLEAS